MPVAHDGVTAQGSESENPAIDAPTPSDPPAADQQGLVAQPARPLGAPPAPPGRQPARARTSATADAFAKLDVEALKRDVARC